MFLSQLDLWDMLSELVSREQVLKPLELVVSCTAKIAVPLNTEY